MMQTSDATRREIAKHIVVVTREGGNPVFRGSSDRTDKPRRTGYPAFAGYDERGASVFHRHCERSEVSARPLHLPHDDRFAFRATIGQLNYEPPPARASGTAASPAAAKVRASSR